MQRLPELDDAVQDLSEALDRRLVLIDESQRAVAYSIHETPRDRKRLSHALAHSATWPRPQTGSSAASIEDLPELGATLFIRLLDSSHFIIGHLVVPMSEAEKAAGDIAPAVMTGALQGAEQLSGLMEAWLASADDFTARAQQLTISLVSAAPQRRREAAETLLAERMISASEHYCAVALGVDPRKPELDDEKATLAVSRTVQFVKETSTATVVGGTLEDGVGVLVFPRPVVVARLTRILQEPPLDHIRAGIGPLTSLEEVHSSFERARIAWRTTWLAPEDHPVVTTAEELGLDGVLARLPIEDFTADDLPLMTRQFLSSVNSPVLLETLEAYLTAGGDAQQTARDLKIHRSTLYYRLDKIRNAISADLRNGLVQRELHTGLRIAKLAKLI